MKLDAGWKRILFWISFVLIFIRIGYIGVRGEVDKEYYVSEEYAGYDLSAASETECKNITIYFKSAQSRLNSLELIFNNIPENKAGAVILKISRGDELVYQTNISLSNVNNLEWHRIAVNAELKAGEEYQLSLAANEDCAQAPGILYVTGNAAPEIVSCYNNTEEMEGKAVIRFGYLEFPGIPERIAAISIWLWVLAAIYLFLRYFEGIYRKFNALAGYVQRLYGRKVFFAVTEILACMVIISSSGIEFQEQTKIVFFILSLVCAANYSEKKAVVEGRLDTSFKRGLLYLLYVYAAFALVGQRLFIYPLTVRVTISGLFVFLIAVIWWIPVVNTFICCIEKLSALAFSNAQQMKIGYFIILCAMVLLIPAAYNLFANNPGISSNDTYNCMVVNAKNLYGMYDWHPFFYCLILRIIQKVWDSTYAVILVQYFFWIYVMLELLLYLRKKGMKDAFLICIALFSGINAANFIHLNTIWKDIPYALSLLWAFLILAKLSVDDREYSSKWYIYLELIVSLIGVCLYRKNGIVPFILIAVALLIVLRRNRKIWASVGVTFALIFIIKGPVYQYFEVVDPGKYGTYIGLSQDILGVYYAGGEVSESTLQMINVMTDYNNAEYSYNPTWANQTYNLDVDSVKFVLNYMDTFLKNPVTMARSIIARIDAVWDIFRGKDAVLGCVNHISTAEHNLGWNEYYQNREYVSLYTWMSSATAYTANTQWISAIEWRSGLFTLLGLISAVWMFIRKGLKKHLILLIPILGQIVSLLLSTGWSDFRYFWPLNLMNMGLILICFVVLKEKDEGIKG